MISIIVSSKDSDMHKTLLKNVDDTIGFEYEWICIENEFGKLGICSAYNQGAKNSNGEYLVFVHEDVEFHTINWGEKLVNHLDRIEYGLLGNAGAVYKSSQVASWIDVPPNYYRTNAMAGWGEGKNHHRRLDTNASNLSDVVLVDGMLLAMRRQVWEEFPFDDKTFKGFHFYDLDISMQIGQKYKLAILHDILIEHKSQGNYSKVWYEDGQRFHQKWADYLPLTNINVSDQERKKLEYYSTIKSLEYQVKFSLKTKDLGKGIFRLFYYRPLSRYNWIVMFNILRKLISA